MISSSEDASVIVHNEAVICIDPCTPPMTPNYLLQTKPPKNPELRARHGELAAVLDAPELRRPPRRLGPARQGHEPREHAAG